MIIIKIALIETSQVIEHQAKNAYTKGPFYCVYGLDGLVHKYPIANIWRITEQYGDSGRAPNDPPMPRKP